MCHAYDDSPIKALVIHMILFIVVTWREIDDSTPKPFFLSFFLAESTTKNSSYTSIFFPALSKTAVIGQPIPIARFQKPLVQVNLLRTAGQSPSIQNCCYRSLIAAIFETASIGGPITAFHKRHYMAKFSNFYFFYLFIFFCKQPIMTILKLPLQDLPRSKKVKSYYSAFKSVITKIFRPEPFIKP